MNDTMNWRDLSEVCFGLILTKRVSATKFHKDMFVEPYDKAFTAYFDGASKTKISAMIGPDMESAIAAAETVSDQSAEDVEWGKNLLFAAKSYALGKKLESASRKLVRGEIIKKEDATEYASAFNSISDPDTGNLIVSSDIDIEGYEPTIPCGYPPIDSNLGGIAEAGNILIMATTGQGKSLFTQQFIGHFLDYYPKKKAGIWSLEMTNKQYLYRGLKDPGYPKFKKAHEEGRILVSDSNTNIYDIGVQAAAAGVDFIIVDYIDYLVKGEATDGKYGEIYVQMNNISRSLNIPFMMLVQPNRTAYFGGIPEKHQARYSGMAENVAAQFWVLYQPHSEQEMNGKFIYVENSMYIVAWKQRFNWAKGCPGPGAIVLPRTKNLWSDEEGDWIIAGEVPMEIEKKPRRKVK